MAALLVAFVLQVPFARGTSVLQPLSVERPDEAVFPLPEAPRHLPPFGTEVTGAKATNKFWANWVVEEGRELSIHPMPYVLRYDESTGSPNMRISRSSSDERVVQYGDAETNGAEKIRYYFSPFVSEFGLGAIEGAGNDGQVVVKEGLFGIHTEVRGPVGSGRKIVFPIYSGMSYVSGLYSGFTPKITSDRALLVIERVSNGIWRLLNNGGKEFRLYAVDPAGNFADETFDFHSDGRMSSAFEGWIRLAEVQAPEDRAILDFHAPAVLVDWQLDVEHGGAVKYSFTKHAAVPKQILHFAYAHHQKLMAGNAQVVTQLTLAPPTKGLMKGVAGDMWLLQVNQSEAKSLGFLPAGAIDSNRVQTLKEKAYGTLQFFLHSDQWKSAMFRGSYYFSGKGFQKVAYTCLLLEKFYGREHSHTQACANLLIRGFECLYSPRVPECNGAPLGLYYDASWHGVASREGFSDLGCRNADFGNACYNDHHYHFSYFVVSAAVLVKLKPEFSTNQPFVSFVDTLIRDTANPSSQDLHFPTFRSFDWFDLHSWSRGVIPSADGKDQESTSEELNLLYGIQLWGMVLQREPLRELGMTMLSLCATTIREFFLMTEDNPHHPADFVTNHVTGIFFQNKVDYATWFGWRYDFIHGIQMLPVTPAVLMIRTPKFCQQEWDNVLSHLPLSPTDPWTSLLVTGTLAIINPEDAYSRLSAMLPEHMDDGLTHVWALYWSASLSTGGVVSSTTGGPSSTVSVPQEENLALYRLAVASSELSADFGAARAVDGLSVTRWSPSLAEANPWIFIDLGDVHALSHIMVLWGEFYPSSYLIQGKVFETDEWTTLAVSMGSALLLRSDLPQPTFARWVRVVSQSAGDLRLWEFQVFGDADTSVTAPTTALSTTASTMPTTAQSTMATTSSEATSTTMSTMPETTTTVVTVATSSTVSGPSTTTPFYGPNLAFRKPVLSSSFRSATEHAWKAVDGDAESQWASVDSTDQWLWVDLLGLYAVNRVVILFGDYPPQFVLQTAPDGIRWMDVATATGAHGFVSTEFNPPIITQWLRVICQTACSIQELMVHGNLPGAVTSSTSSTSSLLATSTTEAGTTAPSTTESTGTTGTPTRVNLALNRPVLASSQRLSNEHVSRMVDGVIESQWASASTDAHPWAWVDLLSSYNVREVAVRWGSSVAQYEVQTSSNGVHWTAVAAASGIAGELVRTALPETAAAQWIRIACSSLSPSSSCIIQELYVYDVAGQSGPETTATTAPSAPTTAPTTAEPTTAPMENIALLKPVLSSSQVLPNNFAARAVDGLETTQWTSAPGEQWIWVDLLGRYDLDHVMVSWGSTRPNSFDLETSFNAVNWDVAVPNIVANEGSQRIDVPGAKAQWLRVHCKVATEGCSIQELKVHGTPTSSRMLRGLRKGT